MSEPTMTIPELALAVVACPRCGAPAGVSCATAMQRKAEFNGDKTAARELAAIALADPRLAHPERLTKVEELVASAEAYGLVRRVPREDR